VWNSIITACFGTFRHDVIFLTHMSLCLHTGNFGKHWPKTLSNLRYRLPVNLSHWFCSMNVLRKHKIHQQCDTAGLVCCTSCSNAQLPGIQQTVYVHSYTGHLTGTWAVLLSNHISYKQPHACTADHHVQTGHFMLFMVLTSVLYFTRYNALCYNPLSKRSAKNIRNLGSTHKRKHLM